MSDKVLAVDDVVKVFEEGAQRVEVLKGVSLDVAPGRGGGARRAVGLGQDHAALDHGLHPHPHRGHG